MFSYEIVVIVRYLGCWPSLIFFFFFLTETRSMWGRAQITLPDIMASFKLFRNKFLIEQHCRSCRGLFCVPWCRIHIHLKFSCTCSITHRTAERHAALSRSLARSSFAKPCHGYKCAISVACQWNVNSPWLLWSLHLGKEPPWCPSPVFKAHAHTRVHQGWAPIRQTCMVVIIKHSHSLRQVQRCLKLPRHSPHPRSKRQSQLSFFYSYFDSHINSLHHNLSPFAQPLLFFPHINPNAKRKAHFGLLRSLQQKGKLCVCGILWLRCLEKSLVCQSLYISCCSQIIYHVRYILGTS